MLLPGALFYSPVEKTLGTRNPLHQSGNFQRTIDCSCATVPSHAHCMRKPPPQATSQPPSIARYILTGRTKPSGVVVPCKLTTRNHHVGQVHENHRLWRGSGAPPQHPTCPLRQLLAKPSITAALSCPFHATPTDPSNDRPTPLCPLCPFLHATGTPKLLCTVTSSPPVDSC